MSNPIRDILYDMDLEFTSTIPMSDEQADEVYERYAKIVTKAVVDEFVERLEKEGHFLPSGEKNLDSIAKDMING